MATCAAESEYGKYILEQGDEKYFIEKTYSKNDRGTGYIQLTHRNLHLEFLEYMGDKFTVMNTAEYIAENYNLWLVSTYTWTKIPFGNNVIMNEYSTEHGLTKETF